MIRFSLSILALAPFAYAATESPSHPTDPVSAIPETTVRAYADFGSFAVLPRRLDGQPDRVKELKWVIDCRERLIGSASRAEAGADLLKRFRKEFDPSKVSAATAVAFATIVGRFEGKMTREDADYAAQMLHSRPFDPDPEFAAVFLYASAKLYRRIPAGKWSQDDIAYKEYIGDRFMDYYAKEWSDPETQQRILHILGEDPCNVWTVKKDKARRTKFFERLAALPREKLSATMCASLGDYYKTAAWDARGSARAANTSPKQFEEFAKILPKSGEFYRAAIAKGLNNARPYSGLMVVAMANEEAAGAPASHWMDEVKKKKLDNGSVWGTYAFANAPRWCGDPSAILQAYEECIKSKNTESFAASWAPHVLQILIKDSDGAERDALMKKRATDYITVANRYIDADNRMGKRLIGNKGEVVQFRAEALALLLDAGLIDKIGEVHRYENDLFNENDPTSDSIDTFRDDRFFRASMIFACHETKDTQWLDDGYPGLRPGSVGDMKKTVIEDDLRLHGDARKLTEYGERLKSMSAKTKSPVARQVIGSLLELNNAEKDFVAGKSTRIPFGRDAWMTAVGFKKWSENSIADTHRIAPHYEHFTTSMGIFRPPYELSVRIKSQPDTKWPHVGIFVGRFKSGNTGRAFVLESDTGTIYALPPGGLNTAKIRRVNKGVNSADATLRVRIFPHGYAIRVDNQPWSSTRDDGFIPYRISLGSLPGFTNYGHFEYSDLTITPIKAEQMSEEEKSWMQAKPNKTPEKKTDAPAKSPGFDS